MERETRFELATSTLARSHSTTELLPQSVKETGRNLAMDVGPVKRKMVGVQGRSRTRTLVPAARKAVPAGTRVSPSARDRATKSADPW